jgi:alkylation response protein AidB-like acyl-CoA dehydrogenase
VTLKAADGALSHGNIIYVPRSDFEIDPTWHCVGLQGTGSDTAVAKNVFVPRHRLVPASKSFDHKDPTRKHFGAPSDYWPLTTQIRTTSLGMKIGAAETILNLVKEQVKTKPIVTTAHSPAASSQVVQMEIGAAAAKISAALQIGQRATTILDDAGLDARVLTFEERAMLKGEHGLAFELLSEATNRLMYVAGSSAFLFKNDLQRFWRDLNVAARHVAYLPNIGYELYGRSLLNIEPNVIPFGGY